MSYHYQDTHLDLRVPEYHKNYHGDSTFFRSWIPMIIPKSSQIYLSPAYEKRSLAVVDQLLLTTLSSSRPATIRDKASRAWQQRAPVKLKLLASLPRHYGRCGIAICLNYDDSTKLTHPVISVEVAVKFAQKQFRRPSVFVFRFSCFLFEARYPQCMHHQRASIIRRWLEESLPSKATQSLPMVDCWDDSSHVEMVWELWRFSVRETAAGRPLRLWSLTRWDFT